MAFPTIPTVGAGRVLTGVNTAGGAAGVKTFPSLSGLTKNAGDLLIAICIIYDGNSTNAEFSSWGGGFTEFGDFAGTATMGIGCAYKISDGTETGTFTVTTADTSTNDSAFFLLSIPGADVHTAPEAGSFATGTGASNPASFNPAGWGTEDTLWIAVGGSGETSTSGTYTGITAAPTNYTSGYVDTGISADVVGGVEGALGFRQLNAASEDVGAFTGDTSNARDCALVIAVRQVIPILRTASDTGVTNTDSIALNKVKGRAITDNGISQTGYGSSIAASAPLYWYPLDRERITSDFESSVGSDTSEGVQHYPTYSLNGSAVSGTIPLVDPNTSSAIFYGLGTAGRFTETSEGLKTLDWTVGLWVLPNTDNDDTYYHYMVGKYLGNLAGTYHGWFISRRGGTYYWSYGSGGAQTNTSIGAYATPDVPHHLAVTCDGTDLTCYIDGVARGTLAVSNFTNAGAGLTVGMAAGSSVPITPHVYHGRFFASHLAYWDRTLDSTEITTFVDERSGFNWASKRDLAGYPYNNDTNFDSTGWWIANQEQAAGASIFGSDGTDTDSSGDPVLVDEVLITGTRGSVDLSSVSVTPDSTNDSGDLDFLTGTSWTVEMSVRFISLAISTTILNKWTPTVGWRIQVNTSGALQFVADGTTTTLATGLTTDVIYHIVISTTGNNATVYINGVSQGTTAISAPSATTAVVTIGGGDYRAAGVVIWTGRNLDSTAAGALYDSTLGEVTDSIEAIYTPDVGASVTASDTGVTNTDSIKRYITRVFSDTGVTLTESLLDLRHRRLTDTGMSFSDSIARVKRYSRTISDTGVTNTDSLRAYKSKQSISDTGVTQTDSLQRGLHYRKTLTDEGVRMASTTPGSYDTAVVTDAPYLYWKLNDSSGPAADSSGNSRPSDVAYGTVAYGGAGPDRSLDTDTSISLTAAGWVGRNFGNDWANPPVTLEMIVLRDPSDSGQSRAFSSERDDFGGAWGPGFNDGYVALWSFGTSIITDVRIEDNKWYHIVWVYDGGTSTWKCYIDGIKIYDAAGFGDTRRSFGPFRIGGYGNPSMSNIVGPFYGKVSRVAVYNGALTEARIQLHAEAWLQEELDTLRLRPITDTGMAFSDSLNAVAAGSINISDTGVTNTDSFNRIIRRTFSDTGLTFTDSLLNLRQRSISDTGCTNTDTVLTLRHRTKSDTGTSFSDTIVKRTSRGLTDTGVTPSDSLVRIATYTRSITDTGTTITDSLVTRRARLASDTGVTPGESLVRLLRAARPPTDTGVTQTDSLARRQIRTLSDIGVAGATGSFPTNSTLLDDFDRSDPAPIGGIWAASQITSGSNNTLTCVGSTRLGDPINSGSNGYINTQYGPDCEFVFDVPVLPDVGSYIFLACNMKDQGASASWDGNAIIYIRNTGWQIRRYDNGSSTNFGTVNTNALVAGDKIGISHDGTTTRAWRYDSVGAVWIEVTNNSDATYQAAGYMGLELGDTNVRLDNARGGTVVSAVSDSLARAVHRGRALSDTGVSFSDVLAERIYHYISDTGVTPSDSLVRVKTALRTISDTGVTNTDSLTRSLSRTISDTGITFSDSLAAQRSFFRAISDTGLTQSDSLADLYSPGTTNYSWPISDTGVTNTDSVLTIRVRILSDTGLTQTDTLITLRYRVLADTLSFTDTLVRRPTRALSDTGLTQTDSLLTLRHRRLSDTGVSHADVLGPRIAHSLSDTLTFSDSLSRLAIRFRTASDTGVTNTDTLVTLRTHSLSDTLTFSDSLVKLAITFRTISDTGVTQSDSLTTLRTHSLSDTGVTHTDSLLTLRHRLLSDTLTFSETLTPTRLIYLSDTGTTTTDSISSRRTRVLSDIAVTNTDSLTRFISRTISDTGLTQTDDLSKAKVITLSDTGVTNTDSLSRIVWLHFTLSDTGVTQTDTLTDLRLRILSDTGCTNTDSLLTRRTRVLSDNGVVLTDVLAERIYHNLSDTGVTPSDTLSRYLAATRTLSDTLTFSDTLVKYASKFLSETLSFTDTLYLLRSPSITDTGVTSSDSVLTLRLRTLTDTLTFTDVLNSSSGNNKNITDNGVIQTDSLARTALLHLTISDTLTFSDSLAATRSRIRTATDTGVTNTDSLLTLRVRVLSDTGVTLTDVLAERIYHYLSDTLTFSDSLSRHYAATRTLSDTLTCSDTLLTHRYRQLSDTGCTNTDSLSRTVSLHFTLTDTLTFSDSLNRLLRAFRSNTDIGSASSDDLTTARYRFFADTLTFSDALTTLRVRTLTDTLTFSDSLSSSAGGSISDTGVTQTDTLALRVGRYISDTGITQTDSLYTESGKIATLTDTGVSQTDALKRYVSRSLSDTNTVSDSLASSRIYTRLLSDTGVNLTDVLAERIYHYTVDTGVSNTDSITKYAHKLISDTGVTNTDSLSGSTAGVQYLTDSGVTQTDTLALHIGRYISDTLTFSETLTPAGSHFYRDLVETLPQSDFIVSIKFNKVYKLEGRMYRNYSGSMHKRYTGPEYLTKRFVGPKTVYRTFYVRNWWRKWKG